ncbi:hypothetical protein ABZT43_10640 [Streptomyces sp. NPDC005349]|uniref:hypothetical protein n=1 Tax=Streptomyces sp. NPDC005349 TaxID=3157037 RepID=UPI0033BB7394
MTGGTFIGSFLFFLTLFGTLKIATFLRRSASPKVFRDKVRVLIEDAAAGEVHAVRVRVGDRYSCATASAATTRARSPSHRSTASSSTTRAATRSRSRRQKSANSPAQESC